jgi:hypothetical protein
VNNFAGLSVELLERRLKSGTAVRLRGGRAAVFSCSENEGDSDRGIRRASMSLVG